MFDLLSLYLYGTFPLHANPMASPSAVKMLFCGNLSPKGDIQNTQFEY